MNQIQAFHHLYKDCHFDTTIIYCKLYYNTIAEAVNIRAIFGELNHGTEIVSAWLLNTLITILYILVFLFINAVIVIYVILIQGIFKLNLIALLKIFHCLSL